MPLRWRLRQARHWLKCRLASPAVILMYHRVAELGNDPYLLAVTPKHFAEHLDAIRALGVPLRLEDLVRGLRRGRVPPRAVAITFDDGYADNLHCAKPLLESHAAPATVFVTAGQVGRGREFWWDELDRLLLQAGTLPPVLRLRLNGTEHEWVLGEASAYSEEGYRRDRHWHVECSSDPGPRQRIFRALFGLVHSLPSAERRSVLDQVIAWAGTPAAARATHQILTSEEAVRLAQGHLVDIGAHTMTHPLLASLPPEQQRLEIHHSKTHLETMLGREVLTFAYPHGSSTPEATANVGKAGFIGACSSHPDAVFRGADRFLLPRLGVRDWDGERFARWLSRWLGD
jgi:peptidoglycan/xylan/chitin deacetylase (PgdA/CDA1 family)